MQWSPRYENEKQTLIFDDDIQLILDLIHDKFFNFIYISEKSPLKQPSKFDKNLINLPLMLDLAVIFPIPNKSKHQYKFEKSKFILKNQTWVLKILNKITSKFGIYNCSNCENKQDSSLFFPFPHFLFFDKGFY